VVVLDDEKRYQFQGFNGWVDSGDLLLDCRVWDRDDIKSAPGSAMLDLYVFATAGPYQESKTTSLIQGGSLPRTRDTFLTPKRNMPLANTAKPSPMENPIRCVKVEMSLVCSNWPGKIDITSGTLPIQNR